MNYTKLGLSGSTNGAPIQLATSEVLMHTSLSGTAGWDEIWLFASNTDTNDHTIDVFVGGSETEAVEYCHGLLIPANSGPLPILPGFVLQNGLVIYALCSVASVVNAMGYVNRIS